MIRNVAGGRYVSATKRFAVFFTATPTAVRLPVSMYAVASAVDTCEGDEDATMVLLQGRHDLSAEKARELLDAAIRVGVVSRDGAA